MNNETGPTLMQLLFQRGMRGTFTLHAYQANPVERLLDRQSQIISSSGDQKKRLLVFLENGPMCINKLRPSYKNSLLEDGAK